MLRYREQCKKSIIQFKRQAWQVPWRERSILLSEAFAFCAMGDMFKIDTILESGIYCGRSTEIWANYFPDIEIYAVERRALNQSTKDRLAKYPNIHTIWGDGPTELRKKIIEFKDRKIGILMDGPKGITGVNFAKEAMIHKSVYFVGVHDMHKLRNDKPNEARIKLEEWEGYEFFTDEKWFIDEYSWLDANESQRDTTQRLTWHPGVSKGDSGVPDRNLGSYGYTIGFAVNEKI